MKRYYIAICGFLVFCAIGIGETKKESKRGGWEVVERDGRSYVTVGQIKEFYKFSKNTYEFEDKEVLLSLPNVMNVSFSFRKDQPMIRINEVRLEPVGLLIWDDSEEEPLVSTIDLASILDPVMRPRHLFFENQQIKIELQFSGAADLMEKVDKKAFVDRFKVHLMEVGEAFDSPFINLKINFEKASENEENSVSSTWQRAKVSNLPIKNQWETRRQKLTVISACALQAGILRNQKISGEVLKAKPFDPSIKEYEIPVVVTLRLRDDFEDYTKLRNDIIDSVLRIQQVWDK